MCTYSCGYGLQSTGLANVTETYHSASATHLSSMDQATQALAEQGAREDAPTGTTPRKRVWEYVDRWELTKSRDAILRAWKERGISGAGSEAFPVGRLHLPEEELDEDTEMAVDEAKSPLVEPEVFGSEYPIAASLASSVSSMASIPVPTSHHALAQPLKKGVGKKPSLPTLGTLTDSRTTNVHTTQGSRRAR
jgi:kinesin family protein 11